MLRTKCPAVHANINQLKITGANTLLSMRTLKMLCKLQLKILFFLSKFFTILDEKDAENTIKAIKVTLNLFRGYLQEKGLRKAKLLNI